MTLAGLNRENLARAAVEGLLSLLADALHAFEDRDIPLRRVLFTGGGARSRAVQQIGPAVLGRDVLVPQPGEYVATGAARQAAWVLTGSLPDGQAGARPARLSAEPTPQVLDSYRERRSLYAERRHQRN